MTWVDFSLADANSGKLKVKFIIFWVGMDMLCLGHRALKSAVSQ